MNKNSIIPAIHRVLDHILSFLCATLPPPVKIFCKNVKMTLATTIVTKIIPTEFETLLTVDGDTPLANDTSPDLDNDEIQTHPNLIKSPLPPSFSKRGTE